MIQMTGYMLLSRYALLIYGLIKGSQFGCELTSSS